MAKSEVPGGCRGQKPNPPPQTTFLDVLDHGESEYAKIWKSKFFGLGVAKNGYVGDPCREKIFFFDFSHANYTEMIPNTH